MKKNSKPCPVDKMSHKSLKNKMRFLVNVSIMISVFLVCLLLIVLIRTGINKISNDTSYMFIDDVQGVFDDLSIQAETKSNGIVTGEELIDIFNNSGIYKKNIGRILDRIPVFSTSIMIDNEVVYQVDAEKLMMMMMDFNNSFMNEADKEEILDNANNFEIIGTKIESDLTDHNGKVIGTIVIGIDSRIEYSMYFVLIAAVVFIGLLVIIIMRFITAFSIKPILKPIDKLQKQLELLADESYEDINPTIIVDKRAVREVKALSDATNKLLSKMLRYNEVITQSEKMASVGQLTAAITHEINTPLGVINANAGLMKMLADEAVNTCDSDEKQRLLETLGETADTTEEACSRIQEIIKSLRSYSRIDQADFMPASINESMKSVVTLTTNLHKNRIKIIEEFGELPDVSCYIGLINQVFMNLIINAIQAIEGEGSITLRTTSDESFVYASVIDSGVGISSKNIYRIFEYGFTTKQPGSGSGIGLALSNNIIHKHNGEIIVESNEGKGATITVKIPINQHK